MIQDRKTDIFQLDVLLFSALLCSTQGVDNITELMVSLSLFVTKIFNTFLGRLIVIKALCTGGHKPEQREAVGHLVPPEMVADKEMTVS